MWDGPQPSPGIDPRFMPRFGLGVYFAFKARDRARSIRRSAKRMKSGVEREVRLASADWLEWASEHPTEAVAQVERAYDAVVHPRTPPVSVARSL